MGLLLVIGRRCGYRVCGQLISGQMYRLCRGEAMTHNSCIINLALQVALKIGGTTKNPFSFS
jgi:hypothetical protein